jgi:hypothetical protein
VSAPLKMRDFARAVLPYGSPNGTMVMLAAYLDDSGTHQSSDIVLMAGFFGYPNQWDYFSELWAEKLAAPCPGKPPLSRFHMTECQAGDGEFLGWRRVETDFLVHELGSIIIKAGLYGFGGAIARKHYDQLITGDLRRSTGDAETMCIINSFVKIIDLVKRLQFAQSIALIFDDRPQIKGNVQKIFDVYKGASVGSDIVALSFASSKKILPLQAADLLAWEIYQDALSALAGRPDSLPPNRPQFERLIKQGRIWIEYCSPESVQKMARHPVNPELLSAMANHLDFD